MKAKTVTIKKTKLYAIQRKLARTEECLERSYRALKEARELLYDEITRDEE